ncbi:MobA/MobL family protein [Limimaricola soesokkakensis]|uniref:MobA/MobL family protein n=1 Tax=Limimaricola soesokkakensis TaxID=1343159 RepID=UPI00355AAFA1
MKTAAYCARTSYWDARLGQRFTERQRGGLLSHELVNWASDAESLWNAAEKAETRINSRVVRELRPSLPAELPLDQQVRLVRGYCLWLRDTYGVAVQANVHAPRFKDPELEARLRADRSPGAEERYRQALFDPEKTNLNFHAHILMTTRMVDRETGAFGDKTNDLDRKKTGPSEILKIRKVWETRTNAALAQAGAERRVDLRSYRDMAKARDAPEGLIAQKHLGPAQAARGRRFEVLEEAEFQGNIRLLAPHSRQAVRDKLRGADWDTSEAGVKREAIRRHNEDLWLDWILRRARLREEAREVGQGFQEALDREVARKRTVRPSAFEPPIPTWRLRRPSPT